MHLTAGICLKKDDMKAIGLSYILMYFNDFKRMLMPHRRNFGKLYKWDLRGASKKKGQLQFNSDCKQCAMMDYFLPAGLQCLTLLQSSTYPQCFGFLLTQKYRTRDQNWGEVPSNNLLLKASFHWGATRRPDREESWKLG